jgi:hypothetical protein
VTEHIRLIVPIWGGLRFKLDLPPDVAEWLRDQLDDALGETRQKTPRRPVRLRRGRWVDPSLSHAPRSFGYASNRPHSPHSPQQETSR